MDGDRELLPCPFCGAEPMLTGLVTLRIGCAECGIYLPVETWNRRSQPSAPRAEAVEALQAIEHALRMGFSPADVLDENSPIRHGIRAAIAQGADEGERNV